jgi:hypothetical protein
MARKQATERSVELQDAIDEWKEIAIVRGEIAKDAYDFQDEKTKAVLDRIVQRLREASTGYVNVQVNPPAGSLIPVKMEARYIGYNLLYIATEILKDLAMFDVRVETYKFPPSLCVSCGANVTAEKPKKRRRG